MTGKPRRGGLGRGLGALIPSGPAGSGTAEGTDSAEAASRPDPRPGSGRGANRVPSLAALTASSATDFYFDPSPVPGATFREIPTDEVVANAKQPRTVFDEQALEELTHSVREFGVLQPIVVRPRPRPSETDDAEPGPSYELVMGERRLRASVAAGLKTVPAIIRDTDDDAMLRDALLENIHRVQLNPLEEAAAYQQLLEEFGATHDELATRIGRSRSQVTNTIRLMNLPVPVQRRVAAGILSAGHARALLGLNNRDGQEELATRIVAEGLSVRATEELVTLAATSGADAGTPSTRRKPAPRITAPALAELANNLSDALDTRVRVDLGRRKGKITVEFGSIDDLERIVAVIAPSLATKRTDGDGSTD